MLKVDKATQTDIKELRKKRIPKQIKIIKQQEQEQKQDKQIYIKPLFNLTFDKNSKFHD